MNKGYRKNLSLTAWVAVLFLQLQVVKPSQITYLRASSGDIKSLSYPQNYAYPSGYFHEWQILAPRGYRIRLTFRDFNLTNCSPKGYLMEVWYGTRMLELCGQQRPASIESSGREMEVYFYSQDDTRGVRFWAYYEWFSKNEVETTKRSGTYTTLKTGDGDTRDSGMSYSTQRLYLIMTMMGCIIFLIIVTITCGCKRRRRRRHRSRSQRPAQTNVPNNTDLENEEGILELNFGDPPPSYQEATRQSVPDVSSLTQEPSTATENEGIDATGLPSYREALRLSQQSLGANV